MKNNSCLLIAFYVVLQRFEFIMAETESALGYKLIGKGNCVSDNSKPKMVQTLDACAAQCTQLNTCVRFVFDVNGNDKSKASCWLKISPCTVEPSLGKMVYEKMVTGTTCIGYLPPKNIQRILQFLQIQNATLNLIFHM